MRPFRYAAAVLLILLAAGCRRDAFQLDESQRVAYAVKPAVVRINAFATGDFRYRPEAIGEIERRLRDEGRELRARRPGDGSWSVTTGAGGSGSGFVIDPGGVILTSGHVIAATRESKSLDAELVRNGAIAALVRHFPIDTLREMHREETLEPFLAILARGARVENVKVVNQVELSNGRTHPFEVLRFSPALSERGSDLAILRIRTSALPALPLGDSDAVRVGESIWAVGYPAVASSTDEVIGGWLSRDSDLEPTFNPGTITAIRRNVANETVFQSNVAIYRGNSGGPAVNRRGEVIGISTWGHTNAEQIKFLVPVNAARALLEQARVRASTDGELNQRYHAALEAAADGRWLEAKKELDRAAVLFPGSPDILRFRRDAERAIAALPPWKRSPFATLLVVVVGIAAAAGAALGFRRWRRAPAAAVDVLRQATVESVVSPADGVSSPAMLGRFTILNGTRAGERLGLGGSGIRIGRESTICEIVLENPKVSRLHAEVVSIDGKVLLIDRNSSNGTYVNDQKVDRTFLQDGDIIYFGGRNAVAVAFHA
jgi:serine protease Do